MDFAALPPEINSGLMYSGAGPGPMLAAAAAWDALATQLHCTAVSYGSVVSDLESTDWHGPSAASMAAAVAPYIEWMNRTAAQAEQTAIQGKAAVFAYEAAFASTVPPPVIAANRSLLAFLIATNILGQNTPAIAATEAHYAAMWAQDATAMYGYAAASASATRLTPFTLPPQTTNPNGPAAQEAAVARSAGGSAAHVAMRVSQLAAQVPGTLQQLATAAPAAASTHGINGMLSSVAGFLNNMSSDYTPLGIMAIPGTWWLTALQSLGLAQNAPGVAALLGGAAPITGVLEPLSGGYMSLHGPLGAGGVAGGIGNGAVLAGMGRAASIGGLSVPSSWASAAPVAKTAAALMPGGALDFSPAIVADGQSGLFSELALSNLAGRAVGGSKTRSAAGATVRVIDREADLDLDNPTTATILVIPAPSETEEIVESPQGRVAQW